MEKAEFGQRFFKAFNAWQLVGTAETAILLNNEIEFARQNGIDLVLKVPKNLLGNPRATKPLYKSDVLIYAGVSGSDFLFEIPADSHLSEVDDNKRLSIRMNEPIGDDESLMILRHFSGPAFGVFNNKEVSSLELK